MTSMHSRQRLQFTLDKFFGAVALCTPVMLVSRAEWNNSLPLFTMLTLYVVILAINGLLFGNPFSSRQDLLTGSVKLLAYGLLSYLASAVSLAYFAILVAPDNRLDFTIRFAIWFGCLFAIVAANQLLVQHRRYIIRAARGSRFTQLYSNEDVPGIES